jgi:ATP-dependent Lon protease
VEKTDPILPLISKVRSAQIPEGLSEKTLERLNQLLQLKDSPTFLPEMDRISRYIDWITALPWSRRTKDILDIKRAREVMDKNHYGLEDLKNRILEYMSIMILKSQKQEIARAPILCFVGLVGTGKTTIAMSIAEALGRKVARIPFGGMGDPLDLRGQSRAHLEAEPGKIIKSLRAAGSKNPVILLDEIDRVTDEGRASIMGVLVELLDPRQNHAFVDHYIDYPFDLSEAIFIATANNTTGIATAVMDRLEPINMPSYTDQEKIEIGRKYLLPRALSEAGIPEGAVTFDDGVWPKVVRPLGYDAGIRTLERTIKGVVRKVARMIVEGKAKTVIVSDENVKEYLPQW